MASEIRTYKCPSCGAELNFSPGEQKIVCPFCNSRYDIADLAGVSQQIESDLDAQQYAKGEEASQHGYTSAASATDDTGLDPRDLRVYKCPSCGAQVVTDKTTVATNCAFCGTPVVIAEQLDTDFRPRWIIPFQVEKSRVESIYWNYVKSRPFTPGKFRSRSQIEKIKCIYLPFWLYDMDMQGTLTARGERTMTTADAHFVYVTHQVYDIRRAGTRTLSHVPVDASSRSPDDAMDSIEPFDLNALVPFDTAYLSGFLAERYDEDENQCYERARRRAGQTMADVLNRSVGGYQAVQVTSREVGELRPYGAAYTEQTAQSSGVRADYALLPVYLLFTKYKGVDYLFAVNGQTGKAVGEVPTSSGRAAAFFFILFAVITAVIFLLGSFVF